METKHEIPEKDRLDEELMDLFSVPVPSSFDEKWRSAIEREENQTMSQFDGNREQKQKKQQQPNRMQSLKTFRSLTSRKKQMPATFM